MLMELKRKTILPRITAAELRAARIEMGLTQEEAAREYNTALRNYKAWELGEIRVPTTIKPHTALLLAKFRKKS